MPENPTGIIFGTLTKTCGKYGDFVIPAKRDTPRQNDKLGRNQAGGMGIRKSQMKMVGLWKLTFDTAKLRPGHRDADPPLVSRTSCLIVAALGDWQSFR